MLRSLWTGASGMIAQQTAVDTISNNLSNINTTGYKKETNEFKTLLYSKLQRKTLDNENNPKPVIGQVGSGVRLASVTSRFVQGALTRTENTFDFALEGEGFFQVQTSDGSVAYTRAGNFNVSIDNNGLALCNSDGYQVLSSTGEPIVFDRDIVTSNLIIDSYGKISYREKDETITDLGIQIGLVQFNNPSGLLKISGSLLQESEASGAPRSETEDDALKPTKVYSGYLEASNVQAVDEMVNLIVAQRAYEMNSKIINASDEMLQQANNLRG
ncbi:MAG: flagellar hook-basal body protein [Lachnospiraceae bacterium]|nr:flagellar hook-basal body protein [Lachnospiraceae bacterium]MBR6358778.1 flagellar hook-basal body protein [Lachnospiraceae bacterium]